MVEVSHIAALMGMPAGNAEKRCTAAGASTGIDGATGNKVRTSSWPYFYCLDKWQLLQQQVTCVS